MTDRQVEALARFASLLDRDGYPPTLHELAASLGRSPTVVFGHLDALVDDGYLARLGPQKKRALSLTPEGRAFVDTVLRIAATRSHSTNPEEG